MNEEATGNRRKNTRLCSLKELGRYQVLLVTESPSFLLSFTLPCELQPN